jgi:hypothetical protein
MVEGTVVARRMATLANVQLHGTHCIYRAMCFSNCCVHTNVLNVYVQVLRKLTSVVVLLCLWRSSNFINSRTVRGRFKVCQHLNDLRDQRWKIPSFSDITSIKERLVYDVFLRLCSVKRDVISNRGAHILLSKYRTDRMYGGLNWYRTFCWKRIKTCNFMKFFSF